MRYAVDSALRRASKCHYNTHMDDERPTPPLRRMEPMRLQHIYSWAYQNALDRGEGDADAHIRGLIAVAKGTQPHVVVALPRDQTPVERGQQAVERNDLCPTEMHRHRNGWSMFSTRLSQAQSSRSITFGDLSPEKLEMMGIMISLLYGATVSAGAARAARRNY